MAVASDRRLQRALLEACRDVCSSDDAVAACTAERGGPGVGRPCITRYRLGEREIPGETLASVLLALTPEELVEVQRRTLCRLQESQAEGPTAEGVVRTVATAVQALSAWTGGAGLALADGVVDDAELRALDVGAARAALDRVERLQAALARRLHRT